MSTRHDWDRRDHRLHVCRRCGLGRKFVPSRGGRSLRFGGWVRDGEIFRRTPGVPPCTPKGEA